MKQNTITTREKIRDGILSTKGSFFSVEFLKKNGDMRRMTARLGVKSALRGGSSTTTHKNHLVTVFDVGIGEYRCINLDTVTTVAMFGQRFNLR